MKGKLFLLNLVALTLASTACSKKNDVKSETDATISVTIKFADLRAYEDGTDTADMQVKTLAVMVYGNQTQVACKEATTAGDLEVKDTETTAGAKALLVAVSFEGTNFQGKPLSDALTMTYELGVDDQDPAKGKHMLTSDATPVTLKESENFYGYTDGDSNHASNDPVQLKHTHTGISFTSVKVDFATQYKDLYNVKFDKGAIMALITKEQFNVFGASLVNADPNYLYGEQHFDQVDNKYTPRASYKEMARLKVTIAEISETITGRGFCVLENNSAEYPTILCIKGELTQKGGVALTADQAKEAVAAGWIVSETDHSTSYPVLVNWEKDDYTLIGTTGRKGIVRDNKYEISLTITGPGTNSPEEPTQERANLDVMCKITPWNIVKQEVVW